VEFDGKGGALATVACLAHRLELVSFVSIH
jgi:hypothetical protein